MIIGSLSYLSRSGSTLLARILNEYNEICVTIEGDFPPEIISLKKTSQIYFKNSKQIQYYYNELLKNTKLKSWNLNLNEIVSQCEQMIFPISGCQLFELFLKQYAKKYKPNASIILYKGNPIMPWEICGFIESFPNSKNIQIIRDPRAVYNSQNKNNDPYTKKPLSISPIQTAFDWRKSIFFTKKISKKNYYEIKYEDLINNNIQIINQLLDFLLVDKKATKRNGNTFTSLIPSVENKIHKNINKDFIKENIEKWKSKLSTKEILYLEKFLQNEMLYKGYNVNNESNELVFMFYIEIIKVKLILFLARIKRIFNGLFKNNRFYLIKLLSKIKYLILKNKA
ncbi:MAG: hypothetical protein CMF80_03940 [Candidatus Marinimicrobia bacterium]|nr:hypothetical protein [Candidatus Neomarinimicrobiota bacterium]